MYVSALHHCCGLLPATAVHHSLLIDLESYPAWDLHSKVCEPCCLWQPTFFLHVTWAKTLVKLCLSKTRTWFLPTWCRKEWLVCRSAIPSFQECSIHFPFCIASLWLMWWTFSIEASNLWWEKELTVKTFVNVSLSLCCNAWPVHPVCPDNGLSISFCRNNLWLSWTMPFGLINRVEVISSDKRLSLSRGNGESVNLAEFNASKSNLWAFLSNYVNFFLF